MCSSTGSEPFDLVLYLGVIYHTENPFASLRQVASLTREHLIVESGGYRLAVMIPYLDYEQLVGEQAVRDMQAVLDRAGAAEFSDEEVMADALKAVKEVRRTRQKKK